MMLFHTFFFLITVCYYYFFLSVVLPWQEFVLLYLFSHPEFIVLLTRTYKITWLYGSVMLAAANVASSCSLCTMRRARQIQQEPSGTTGERWARLTFTQTPSWHDSATRSNQFRGFWFQQKLKQRVILQPNWLFMTAQHNTAPEQGSRACSSRWGASW